MPRLASVTLRVQNSKIEGLKHFYTKVIGMTNVLSWDSEEDIDIFAIPQHHPKYPECIQKHDSADLKIVSKSNLGPYNPSREDLYWKIGLAVNDVNAAADTINAASKTSLNTKANEASIQHGKQFFDIGFMTHINDPCGFPIELLQTTFEHQHKLRTQLIQDAMENRDKVIRKLNVPQSSKRKTSQTEIKPSLLSTQPFIIGQITTRISDPNKSLEFYTDVLKMKLLSIQEVGQYKFTLYFLGYTTEDPPCKDDLKHVDNRKWLWQRKYTTLELQWRWDTKAVVQTKQDSAGLDCIEVELDRFDRENPSGLLNELKKDSRFCPLKTESSNVSLDGCSTLVHGSITDPDGLKIKLISKVVENDSKNEQYGM